MVIGYVLIQSEEKSNLIEKSARNGLHENMAYEQLRIITKAVIGKLEERRFSYCRKAGLSRPALKVESATSAVIALMNREEEEKTNAAEDIRRAVATYQGQATLGKIINVVLHEGRRPLSYFKNEVPRISRFRKKFIETGDDNNLDLIIEITQGVELNSAILSDLFKRLDPLATGRRSSRKPLNIKREILNAFKIFDQDMEDYHISYEINCSDDVIFYAWIQDIYAVFANLIDNSIFWMKNISTIKKVIVDVVEENGELSYIDFRDTGSGIEPSLIIDGLIFEPQFSTKPSGSGNGLAIAGEAADRNNLKLNALDSSLGTYFRLQRKDI